MTPPAAAAPAVGPRRPLAPGRPYAPKPRRVSGPARKPLDERSRRRSPEYAGVAVGLIEALRSVSTHPLLDRLIRGRIWIALVAFALIGIVTLQLGLLKLNAGIGHALQRETALQRENAALSIENSELAAGDIVESSAGRLGMEVVPVGALRFLTARPHSDPGRAAAALAAPLVSAPGPTQEASSGSPTSTVGEAPAGAEGSSQSPESQSSATTPESESQEAKAPSSESSEPHASPEPSREPSTSSPEHAAAPSSGGGPSEASGGTQAGSTGR